LDFAFAPEFLAATSLLEPAEVCRTELKPFLTIFGTSMRAKVGNGPKKTPLLQGLLGCG
jgi:hypothetical protein